MQNTNLTDVAKFAAVVAALITILFNTALYFIKEYIDHRRRRSSTARQLILIGYSFWESLCADVNSEVYSEWYKLVALAEVLAGEEVALSLVIEILHVHSIFKEPSANLRNSRSQREAELKRLKERTEKLCKAFSISSPWTQPC